MESRRKEGKKEGIEKEKDLNRRAKASKKRIRK